MLRTTRLALVSALSSAFLLSGCSSGGTSVAEPCGAACVAVPSVVKNIYALQFATTFPNTGASVLRFNSSDSGSVTPDATLTLPTSFVPNSLTGSSTGTVGSLFLAGVSTSGSTSSSEVLVYAGNATGTANPTSAITGSQVAGAIATAVDPSGVLYVLLSTGTVNVFTPSTGGTGYSFTRTFNASSVLAGTGFAVDASGNVYIASASQGLIAVYDKNATGNATPTRTITGAATGLGHIFQLAVDGSGLLYAGTTTNQGNAGQAIVVFAAGAHDNAAPLETYAGGNTNFNALTGIAVDSNGLIYESDATLFSNLTGPSINIFSGYTSGNVAPLRHFNSPVWTGAAEGSTLAVF